MKGVVLSKRMQAVAGMVTEGNRVCDVGCDHGFVSIYLVEQGISPQVLAMDVRSGPLGSAIEHIKEHNLEDFISARLSDGLHNYNIGEADSLICAGMGGRLIMRILSEEKEKTESFHELVLQPQSEIEQLRRFLRGQGYRIEAENMIEEDSKFYPVMRVTVRASEVKACAGDEDDELLCKLNDRYGPLLLRQKSKALSVYLEREQRVYREILERLKDRGLEDAARLQRYREIEKLLQESYAAKKMTET